MKLLARATPATIFLCMCAVYIAGFFAHALYLKKTVYGDGVYYYSWLQSAVIDHSINFPTGNKFNVGPAILWAPSYLLIHSFIRGDGQSLPYQLAVGFTGVCSALFGLLLLWRLLQKYFSNTVSIMTVATVAGATNLLFYGSVDTVNSHALSFFTAVVFLTLIMQRKKYWFAIGAALGFLSVIRTQDFLFGILLIPLLKKNNLFKIFIGSLAAFSPQLIAWHLVYGKFWVSPYLTGSEGFNFLRPHIFGVLFGLQNGLFLWTPITMLAIAGLITQKRFLLLTVFLLELLVVASWSTWWQGASYSGRMFVSTLPLLAFGIASVFSWLARYKWTHVYFLLTIVIPLSVINTLLMTFFLLNLH
jgi:hypothetical protein